MFKKYLLLPILIAVLVSAGAGSFMYIAFPEKNISDIHYKNDISNINKSIERVNNDLVRLKEKDAQKYQRRIEYLNANLKDLNRELVKIENYHKKQQQEHEQYREEKEQEIVIAIIIITLVVFAAVFLINYLFKTNKLGPINMINIKENYLLILSVLFLILTLGNSSDSRTHTEAIIFAILFGGTTIAYVIDKNLKNR